LHNIEGTKLRVCANYLREDRNKKTLSHARLIILEHLLPTTEELIYLLHEAGADIFQIIAKPYSIDEHVASRLNERGYPVLRESYENLERTALLDDLLRKAVAASQNDDKKILIIDVGGYFAVPLNRLRKDDTKYFAGAVEDTTLGHNRYLVDINSIPVPVVSVARSRLKEIEAQFVGIDAVHAVDTVLRKLGVSMTGRHAVVIGYGMIGKNVARSLKANDLNVSVYDVRDHRNLSAFMKGFGVDKKARLLQHADIVFAATGWSTSLSVIDAERGIPLRKPALSKQEILECLNDDVILASVGSKDNEFDMISLKELAVTKPEDISKEITKYKLADGDSVFVVKGGTAVNFLEPSIPIEVLDLVFSEILLAAIFLLKTPDKYPVGTLHPVPEKYWSYIAKDWMRFANPKR